MMKRDWDLIRRILMDLEKIEDPRTLLEPGEVQGYADETVSYHIRLLIEAGLIEGTCRNTIGAPISCSARRMTWAGHQLLDQIRDQTIWNRIKVLAKEKGVGLTLDVIRLAAKTVIDAMFR